MRVAAVITGILAVFCILVALVISLAIAMGGLIHALVPEIELGIAVLIVMAGGFFVLFMAARLANLVVSTRPQSMVPSTADDDLITDEEVDEEEANLIAERVTEALINRMEEFTPYPKASRRQRR